MGASKFLVLVGGVVGIVSFFLPLIEIKDQGAISAFQVVKGIDTVKDIATGATKDLADAVEAEGGEAAKAEFKKGAGELNKKLSEVKGIVLGLYAPALLMIIIGAVALGRKQFGRLGGTFAFLFGLIALFVWFGFHTVASEAAKDGTGAAGMGIHLYMASGALGAIGGLLALIKPERKTAL